MSLYLYAFLDKKSGTLSNHFVSAEPFEQVKQNISISLLQLSMKEPTNPFVLFASDYSLIQLFEVMDEVPVDVFESKNNFKFVSCEELLVASRKAFESRSNHTSQNEDSPEPKE